MNPKKALIICLITEIFLIVLSILLLELFKLGLIINLCVSIALLINSIASCVLLMTTYNRVSEDDFMSGNRIEAFGLLIVSVIVAVLLIKSSI